MKSKPYKLRVTSYRVTSYKLRVTNRLLNTALCLLLTTCCLLPTAVSAQCNDINIALTPTPSTCQSNGTIRVTVSGAHAANLRMTDAEYSITPIPPSSFSRPWAQATGGTLTDVPPGTYTVGLRAFCLSSNSWTVHNTTATASIASSYTIPNVYFGTIRKTLSCMPSGLIPIVVQDGRATYTITMTARPSAYTGPTTATINALAGAPPRATHNFDDLPAGTYTFSVTDNCSYNTVLTTTVTTASADFAAAFAYEYFYTPATVVQNDCRSVRVPLRNFYSGTHTSHDAWLHYSTDANAAKYYEVALSDNSTTPPTTGWAAPTGWRDYTLPVDFNTFRTQNRTVAVWIRVRGASCTPALLRTVSMANTTPETFSYSNQNCTDYTLTHRMNYNGINVFCFPYEWRITTSSGGTLTNLSNWTSVTTTDNQIVHNVPYGTRIEYRDASGQTWTRNLMLTNPLDQLGVNFWGLCIHNSLPLTSSGILSNYLQVYVIGGGTIPTGTRIETISWPAGGSAPNYPDITITTPVSAVYPYTSAATPTTLSSIYTMTMPGTYTLRVSMPGCPSPRTITTTPAFYSATPISYTAVEGCDGLTVFPTGQIGWHTGSSSFTYLPANTWFFIQSAPNGVTVNTNRVQSGGSLFLPASGAYVIGMAINTDQCAANTLTINYTKRQLSLNAAVTSAYICAGGTVGNIRVQGIGGSGSYTYELRSANGATLHLSNSAGTFSYGSAGQTYLVRVRDNVCNTSFDQSVTILNLGTAAIAYSGSPNNEFCEGGTIQLNCITLGQTTYTWSGPGGWTSTAQNPTRPNATAAMSGTYTVTVTPENCAMPMTQSVVISVVPTPLPNVPGTVRSRCQNTTPPTIASIIAASVTSSSYALRYYDSGGTITPTTIVPTSAATVLTYYVSQYNTATGCESDRVTIIIYIYGLPDAPTVNPVSALCPGDLFTITVSPTILLHRYTVYTWDGILLGASPDGSGVISGIIAPNSSTTYYVSATRTDIFCESASRTPVIITVNPRATTANITASGVSICSGTAATLTATSNLSAPVFNWYDSQTATAPLHTGATYIIGVTVTTTYYVGVSNATTCENALNNRYPVTVTITPTVIPSVTITAVPN